MTLRIHVYKCHVQHTATHCSTLQHTATHCNTLQYAGNTNIRFTSSWHCTFMCVNFICNTLHRTATHCNTPPQTCNTYNTNIHSTSSWQNTFMCVNGLTTSFSKNKKCLINCVRALLQKIHINTELVSSLSVSLSHSLSRLLPCSFFLSISHSHPLFLSLSLSHTNVLSLSLSLSLLSCDLFRPFSFLYFSLSLPLSLSCSLARSISTSQIHVKWFIHTCDMTYSYMWHDAHPSIATSQLIGFFCRNILCEKDPDNNWAHLEKKYVCVCVYMCMCVRVCECVWVCVSMCAPQVLAECGPRSTQICNGPDIQLAPVSRTICKYVSISMHIHIYTHV